MKSPTQPAIKSRMAFFIHKTPCLWILLVLLALIPSAANAESPAGYSEYYIPGDEDVLEEIYDQIDVFNIINDTRMYAAITVTAWSDNTTVYYDHWEDGYDFDPDDPGSTADEIQTLAARGSSHTFESNNIVIPRSSATTVYDGRDRIYIAGGTASVTRVGWPADTDVTTAAALAWEVYPLQPQLTTYYLPFGEDLASSGLADFDRVFVLIQATSDSTNVTVDLDGDGSADPLDTDWPRDGVSNDTQVTLDAGEVFLLDRDSALVSSLNTGTKIVGSGTLQVQYVIADDSATYEVRGLSAFPRGLWDDEYYAPVDGANNTDDPTDIYLYNPHETSITISYETTAGSGSFTIDAGQAASFEAETGSYVPQGSAVYLKGSNVFWGISTIDAEGSAHDWGYSLVPVSLLKNEHFMGWAPGSTGGDNDAAGIYIAPALDNIQVYIDRDNDGSPDTINGTFDLDRLQSQYVYDTADGDMSSSHIWATGPYTIAYGQSPDYAPSGSPAIDVGYTAIPGGDFIDLVLTVDKTADPVMVPTTAGSTSTYTIVVSSHDYSVDGIDVVDILPAGWQFVDDSTTITLPDSTQISGNDADPAISGTGPTDLTWSDTLLGDMAENQTLTITFTAEVVGSFSTGDITLNSVEATGTRTVQSETQTFSTLDFAFNGFGNLEVEKTADATDPLYPGDQFTYTVTVTNPATAISDLTGIGIYDALPEGVGYVASSSQVELLFSMVADNFGTAAYDNDDGNVDWNGTWTEYSDDGSATSGNVYITGGQLRIDNRPSSGTPGIYRSADLTGATSATFTFDYDTSWGVDSTDAVSIYVYNGSWNVEDTITGEVSGTATYDLSSYLTGGAADADIRVGVMVSAGYTGWGEIFYMDNLRVIYDVPSTAAAGDPPNFVTADNGYTLAPGESLTLTFDVTVDDPLGTGIDTITNTARVTTNEYYLPVTDSVTHSVINPATQSAEVGGQVWLDTDGDGVHDVGESGISNVEVTLKDEFGTPVATSSTDSSGNYLFTDVEPGTGYYVQITGGLPSGLEQSAPAGRSDDRTDAFDLAAGDSKPDAVLGYTPTTGTATIGDLVWSDADGDGARDAGEPGLSGVTVELWEVAGTVAYAITTSAADGSYLFTGIPASGSEDYFVYVDDTQTALSAYTATTATSFTATDIDDGDILATFDFGFIQTSSGTTWSITDRIWFDTDDDDVVDSGEGISGATVVLLDASDNVIATASTGADGTFTFSGVPGGGADYTIQITDTAGVLDDYYGISTAAVAGETAINNLTADVDNAASPSFEFGLSRSIQGTVFNDNIDGDGVQDTGEPGISGVTVELFLDDGSFDPSSDTPIAAVTTDAYGNYLFSGLSGSGSYTYFVHVDETQSALSAYDSLTTADDHAAAGHQRQVTMTDGASILGVDFGYKEDDPGTITGTVLDDADGDGAADTGEEGLENVTIALVQASTVVAADTTDADGDYTFSGLPAGTYTVRITDENSVLSGYDTTYEETEGALNGPYDGEESVTVSSGGIETADFRYNKPVPTLVGLSAFRAFMDGGQVVVEWETGFEVNTVGFYLYRKDGASYLQLNDALLPGLVVSPQGGIYQFIDDGAGAGGTYTYQLMEVEANGTERRYGPFTITVDGDGYTDTATKASAASGLTALSDGYGRQARQMSSNKLLRTAAAKTLRMAARIRKKDLSAGKAKLFVSQPGLYYLSAETIADLLGTASTEIQSWISAAKLVLERQGRKAAWLAAEDNSGIYFYGEAVDSRYTDRNVYWIKRGNGKVMKTVEQSEAGLSDGQQTFTENAHSEQNNYALTSLYSDPEADFWYWDYIFSGYSGLDEKSFTIRTDAADPSSESATLTVRLKGAVDTDAAPDHHAVIQINGTGIGESYFNGTDDHEMIVTFDPDLLEDGENTITVSGILDTGAAYSLFYVDGFDLTYQRFYRAENNALYSPADGNEIFTISGFSDPDVRVFDVTLPRKPKQVQADVHAASDSSYSVTIIPKSSEKMYYAVASDGVKSVDESWPDESSNLLSKRNQADYLLIAPSALMDGAEALAEYRQGQGLEVMVADLEDIMDEFNDGLFSPEAIRSFLSHAYSSWNKAPVYVVLVGEGTYDPKDYQGYGDSLIPVMLVGTSAGLVASDNQYADVSGDDGLAEMAVGRLPVLDSDELYAVIEKIKAYESSSGDWTRRVLMLADDPDDGGDFETDSDAVAAQLETGYTVEKVYLSGLSIDDARQQVQDSINDGVLIVNYIGHGAVDRLSQEGLLVTSDIEMLTNMERLPIVAAMTCVAGQFALPGFDSLSEALVVSNSGGAIAAVSPTGLSLNTQAVLLNEDFFYAAAEYDDARLGDVFVKAKEFYSVRGDGSIFDLYNLLGDPALKMK